MDNYSKKVQELMLKHNLDCHLAFTADCHLNEYIGPADQKVQFLTLFTGSNGIAITSKEPALYTDSRYYVQAAKESRYPLYKERCSEYIIDKKYKRVGFDTRLVSCEAFKKLKEIFDKNEITFIEVIEDDIPVRPRNKLIYLEKFMFSDYLKYKENDDAIKNYLKSLGFNDFEQNVTGSFYQDKIQKVKDIAGDKILVITELDTISWILNIRGSDIDYNPIFYSYMIVSKDKCILFTDHPISLGEEIEIKRYSEFEGYVKAIKDKSVLISGGCSQYIYSQFTDVEITDAVRDTQTSKNMTELAGMVLSYVYDGIALTNLFGFIKSSTKKLTENDLANKLHELKLIMPGYVGPSFETISSTGTNSAIVHHSSSDAEVDINNVYLLDSGSHYHFGTTDTTRTLYFGSFDECNIKSEEKTSDGIEKKNLAPLQNFIHDNTLVFQGQINVMIKKYKRDEKYSEIDRIAREYLKNEDKSFGHATGHGVGHFLCVHEHPPTVGPNSEILIKENHVFSIEPGYYKENEYGIRIENLVFSKLENDNYSLVNMTMVPYQLSILDMEMLTAEEKSFINSFNKQCYPLLEKYVSPEGLAFLKENSKLVE